ncbi:DUF4407 domain-containing protein [Nostocaceae cyanobacterium CENA369]|uniref:DUF4407 domain-containing protein n=1 Tax=Dendronalium phyllosphericum CENA369 TaxID=1725256 RepID=A0A8J7I8C9_9NOST|nr:DUF4407 domain-containing protein [Dendronalium phyllosphericum]MBH8573467.1 DUF4407 domain-containing protein [Dendronalium phyllosphericum CENA369]
MKNHNNKQQPRKFVWQWWLQDHNPFKKITYPHYQVRKQQRQKRYVKNAPPRTWQQRTVDIYRDIASFAASVYREDIIQHSLTTRYTLIGSMVVLVGSVAALGGFMTGYYLFAGSVLGAWATAAVVGTAVFLLDKMAVSGRKKKAKWWFSPGIWVEIWGTLLLRLMVGGIIGAFFSTSLVIFAFKDNIKQYLEKEIDRKDKIVSIQQDQVNRVRTRARISPSGKTEFYKDEAAGKRVEKYDAERQRLQKERDAIRRGDPAVLSYGRMLNAIVEMGFTRLDENSNIPANISANQYNKKGELQKGLTDAQSEGRRHFDITPEGRMHLIIFAVFFAIDSAPILYKTFFMHFDSIDDFFWKLQNENIKVNEYNALLIVRERNKDVETYVSRKHQYRIKEDAIWESVFDEVFSEKAQAEYRQELVKKILAEREKAKESIGETDSEQENNHKENGNVFVTAEHVHKVGNKNGQYKENNNQSVNFDDFMTDLKRNHEKDEPDFKL